MLPHNTQPVLQPWHCLHVVVYDTPTRYCNVHTFKSGWYLAFHVVLLYHFYFHVHHCCWGNIWWEMHSKFPCHACMNFPAKWKCFPENMIALELAPVEIHRFHLQSRKNITIRRQRMPWEKINTWWYPASHVATEFRVFLMWSSRGIGPPPPPLAFPRGIQVSSLILFKNRPDLVKQHSTMLCPSPQGQKLA